MRYFLVVFDYFMVFIENDSVCSFTFIEKEGFDGHPEFLVSLILLELNSLKYYFSPFF